MKIEKHTIMKKVLVENTIMKMVQNSDLVYIDGKPIKDRKNETGDNNVDINLLDENYYIAYYNTDEDDRTLVLISHI